MKTISTIVLLLGMLKLCGQSKTETINKELSFEKFGAQNTLIIDNINGSVSVEGYSGQTVRVQVVKTIRGKTPERLDAGMKDITLGVVDIADTLILYVKGLCPPYMRHKSRNGKNRSGWGYSWDDCEQDELKYDYKLDFKVQIPPGVHVNITTINDGEIRVQNVTGKVVANNINGGITVENLVQSAQLHTINGDVSINYSKNPTSECKFYTLNGDINALFQRGLAANVSFKSFNGEFFTNLQELAQLPLQVQKSDSDKGTKYEINSNQFKAGKGGALLDFETFNGDVYLKEK